MIKKMPIRREKTLRKSLISCLFLSIPVYSCLPPEKGKALNAMQMQCKCNANAMQMQCKCNVNATTAQVSPAESRVEPMPHEVVSRRAIGPG